MGSPGAASFYLGRPQQVTNDDVDDDISAMSDLSGMTRVELVEIYKKLQLKKSTKHTGSPPDQDEKQSAAARAGARGKKKAESISITIAESNIILD